MKHTYKDEAEVVALIDKYLKAIVDTNQMIINKDILCSHLRETMESNRIAGIRDEITTLTREVAWREGRLETLKEILAEMRTAELPFGAIKNCCCGQGRVCPSHGPSPGVIE